jgi:hypothetical protein
MIPIIDSTRSALLNQAFLARDAETGEQHASIVIGTLGWLGLSTVSPLQWEKAEQAFEDLQQLYAAWLMETESLAPWASPVETGLFDPDWPEALRVSAKAINSTLNFLVCLGFLRNWTPRDRVALDAIAKGAS